MNTARIADQIAQVDRDLSEIDEQLEAGEFDEATAERLRAACRSSQGKGLTIYQFLQRENDIR